MKWPNTDETLAALRVNLNDCYVRPAILLDAEKPKGYVGKDWIPQTLYEEIWVVYRFPSERQRLEWEVGLSPLLTKWLDRGLIATARKFRAAGH